MSGGGKLEGGEGWHEVDNSSQQPIFLFLLVFLSAVYPAGFDEKIPHVAVQNNTYTVLFVFNQCLMSVLFLSCSSTVFSVFSVRGEHFLKCFYC